MNKKLQIIYCTAFLALCTAPLACMPLVKADDTSENRKLSEMPPLTVEGKFNTEWSSGFETYFSEHFAFRPQLVTLDSLIKSEVFRTSSNDKVIVGKNGWLYFADTLPDYTGENTMSERRLYNTAKTIRLMQEHFENDGRSFMFFSAPNKSSVYSENMPSRYIKSNSPTNLERLKDPLDSLEVNYIELAQMFRESDKTLYLERDSHWTNEGALMAYNAAADYLGMKHNDFSQCAHSPQKVWRSDLDGMLFPGLEQLSFQEIYDYEFTFAYRSEFISEDDLLIKTKSDIGNDTLLMYRDSFGRAFYPFAAENASKASFSRTMPYKTDLADEIDAKYVIMEIVERNLSNLTESAPSMNAPTRDMDISACIDESDENICDISEKGNTLRIFGELDSRYFEDNSDILITLETDGAVYGYEAFPIYEAKMLGDEDGDSDYGFSLMLDKSDIPQGNYEIYAYVDKDGEYICTQPLAELNNRQ